MELRKRSGRHESSHDTRAKKMLEIANDLRDLLGEQEGGTQ